MNLLEASILGLIQGLTEFLPVSSSGHLILMREFLGITGGHGLAVDAVLQLATACAVIIYFHRDLMRLAQVALLCVQRRETDERDRTLILALMLGTLPAVIVGVFLEDYMDAAFRSASLVALTLIAGSVLFVIAEYVAKRIPAKKPLTIQAGVIVGLFQALALVPGVSRSGATISGGLLLGLSREDAARFGFLLSVPIILGSGGKKLLELQTSGVLQSELVPIALAAGVAFASGLAAIHVLIRYLKHHSLRVFAAYRVVLALVVLVLVWL